MKTSIATVSLSGTLGEKLDAIAAAKFDAVEIFESDLITFNGSPREVRRLTDQLGIGILALQPFRDFEGMPNDHRQRVFARAERKFDVMGELGCDLLMICSNVSADSLGGIDRAAADLRELAERASKRGLRIAFEALAWGRHINDYRDAWEAVRRARSSSPRLGARQLPHSSAQDRPQRHSRRPSRSHLPGADGRRPSTADGLSFLEPPFPQLPGARRLAAPRLHGSLDVNRI